jgi:hypothetical protein
MRCERCNGTYVPTLPASMSVYAAICRAFVSDHSKCLKSKAERLQEAKEKRQAKIRASLPKVSDFTEAELVEARKALRTSEIKRRMRDRP